MAVRIVTLGTDGATNFVQIHTGQKYNLGTRSPIKLIQQFCSKQEANAVFQDFIDSGSASLRVDLDILSEFLSPPARRRLAKVIMELDTIGDDVGMSTLEDRVAHLEKLLKVGFVEDDDADDKAEKVKVALQKVASTSEKISRLEKAGRPFRANDAREDLAYAATNLRKLLASKDISGWMSEDLDAAIQPIERIHSLFAKAK